MANTPTTLSRAAFSGQKGSTVILKFTSMASYALGTACNVGIINGVITNVLNSNTVKLQVLGAGPASSVLLLPKGTAVS